MFALTDNARGTVELFVSEREGRTEIRRPEGRVGVPAEQHIHKRLTATPWSDSASRAGSPGRSPIDCDPGADEIYDVVEGNGLFSDGQIERQLGPGETVIFPVGEVDEVTAITRMVLYACRRARTGPESLNAGRSRR